MKFQNISTHGSKHMQCTWKQQLAKKLQRAITPTKFHKNCQKFIQIIFFSAPISIPNIKTLAQINFEILLTRFQCYFILSAITLKDNSEIIRIRKNYGSPIFSWGIHIWIFKTLAYMVLNLCNAHERKKIKKARNSKRAITPTKFH